MQTKYAFAVFCVLLFASLNAYSQSALDSTPANCKWNLQFPIYKYVVVSDPFYYGKRDAYPPYNQVTYAGETECQLSTSCIVNDTTDLKMIVYFPTPHNYDSLPLPVLIYSHSGGFSDCSSYNIKFVDSLCRLFAKRGFVTFKLEYRRGRIKDPIAKYTSVQQMIAMYKSCQDMRGAIRSIIKLQRNHSALHLRYQVDTNKIFLGGASAGAVMSLNAGYYRDQQMIDTIFPTAKGYPKMKDVFGPINANYYYGDTSISIKGKIKGVLSLWGGASIPLSYENKQEEFFRSSHPADNPPMIGFHGLGDPVFPISGVARQRIYYSPPAKAGAINYNTEIYCVSNKIVLDTVADTPDIIIASGLNMYNILRKLGKLTEFYEDCEMKHGLANDCDTCPFQNDFGTGYTSEGKVWTYIAQRTATFFQAAMNNAKPSDFGNATTLFVNCQNNRAQCNYSDNDNSCSNADTCITTISFASVKSKNDHVTMQDKNSMIENGKSTKEKIVLYPNPVKDIVTIKGLEDFKTGRLFIINALGNVLFSESVTNSQITKNVSALRPGVYYIKIQSNRETKIISFIKQ